MHAFFPETSTFWAFAKHKVYRKKLYDMTWTEVGSVSTRMDGAVVIWFDDDQTRAWVTGGRIDSYDCEWKDGRQ